MGRTQAEGFAQLVAAGECPLDSALHYHLTANHYPPVPASMIDPCKAAIEAGSVGDWQREIDLPEGVLYRGEKTAPACAVIEQHHLEAFLPDVEPDDYY